MRTSSFVLAALLFLSSVQGTQAGGVLPLARPVVVPYYPGLRNVTTTRVGFAPSGATVSPDEIAACANLAALRALGARTAGADTTNQSRLAELTFVFCLANSPAAG